MLGVTDTVMLAVGVTVAVTDAVMLGVTDTVMLAVGVTVGVAVLVGVGEAGAGVAQGFVPSSTPGSIG
jgi:hypothetical protein